MTLLAIFKILP